MLHGKDKLRSNFPILFNVDSLCNIERPNDTTAAYYKMMKDG